jgi:hypothetical protein
MGIDVEMIGESEEEQQADAKVVAKVKKSKKSKGIKKI